ncbi:hypothetical protein VKT23_006594 [Stygiomarasmius scandens]|uniref:Natural killer-tumor recognition protein n=1 Tax=Marasmiellus scandens TaxID=2682957 RepID=A0ABR1JSX6_9AGAR
MPPKTLQDILAMSKRPNKASSNVGKDDTPKEAETRSLRKRPQPNENEASKDPKKPKTTTAKHKQYSDVQVSSRRKSTAQRGTSKTGQRKADSRSSSKHSGKVTVIEEPEQIMTDTEEAEESGDGSDLEANNDSSAAEDNDDEDNLDDKELAQERAQVVGTHKGKQPKSNLAANTASGENSFEFIAPITQKQPQVDSEANQHIASSTPQNSDIEDEYPEQSTKVHGLDSLLRS